MRKVVTPEELRAMRAELHAALDDAIANIPSEHTQVLVDWDTIVARPAQNVQVFGLNMRSCKGCGP